MCSKNFVRVLGFLMMIVGVVVIVMGVTVVTGSSWIGDLMPEGGDTDSQAFASDAGSLGKAFEVLIFVFGIYMFLMGLMACWFCGNKCEGRCCCVLVF